MKELALTIGDKWQIEPPGDLKIFSLNSIVQTAVLVLFISAIIISLVYLIWGGVDYIMSEGDKQRIQAARHKFIFAIIGLVVVLLAFFIVGVVGDIFGINFFQNPFGPGNIQNSCPNKFPSGKC